MTVADGRYAIRAHDAVLKGAQLDPFRAAFDGPNPFVIALTAEIEEIDAFGHVNNTAYQRWMEACAWAHSIAVGAPPEACRALNRGMALRSLEIDYLRASFLDQRVLVANWVVKVDRLRAERRFQVLEAASGATLARAVGRYVCIDLHSGAPVRMPELFVKAYVVGDLPTI